MSSTVTVRHQAPPRPKRGYRVFRLERKVLATLYGLAGAHRRDLVVTTYAMLTRQPWLADVFILSLKAGGIGLNLTAASHVIHFDRWWNPAVENQATDRARFASASTATCSSTSS